MELTHLDYYAALDVAPTAPFAEIERAYQFALESYGPGSLAAYGVLNEEERAEIVKFLQAAYAVLGNAESRQEYNRKLSAEGKYPAAQLETVAAAPQPVPPPAPMPSPPARKDPASASESAFEAQQEPVPTAPAPALEPPGMGEVSPAPAKERNWWPFAGKEKPAGLPEQPATPAAAAQAPPAMPAAQAAALPPMPALDGRPIGGRELREIREARGLRLEEVSTQTKISMSNLRFLEAANYKFLPAPVYVKGFLRTYAKILRVDAEKVVQDYMAAFEAHRQA